MSRAVAEVRNAPEVTDRLGPRVGTPARLLLVPELTGLVEPSPVDEEDVVETSGDEPKPVFPSGDA